MAEPVSILVADDEYLVREGIRHLLAKRSEFRIVAEAGNGLEAVELTAQHQPQIILMDVRMPVLDGLMALEKIRGINSAAKTVILSGYSDFKFAQKALKLGACDYLLKPTDLPELVNVLSRLKEDIQQEKEAQLKEVKIQTQLTYGLSAFMEEFYRQLLSNEFLEHELTEKMKLLEINEEYATVLLIGLDNHYQLKIEKSKEEYLALCGRIKLLAQDFLEGESIPTSPVLQTEEDYYIIINFSSKYAEIIKFAERLKEYFKEKTGELFSVAIGSRQPLMNLGASYDTALSRLKQRLVLGGDTVIATNLDLQETEVHYPDEMEKELAKAVRYGDQTQAGLYLNGIFDWLVSMGKLTPNNWRQLCFDLLEMGFKIGRELGMTKLVAPLEKGREIQTLTTESDIRAWINHYLEELMEKIRQINSGPSLAVKKALSYIDLHFTEDLSLSTLASYIGLSPNYLSQIFKQNTGKTFLEQLTNRRLEEAKKLLRQGELNVSEVSFRVGYNNPRYFSEIFRKREKVTPSQYRKSIR